MKRRRFRKQYAGMSLFPFLAVLICTMGALIVLLVLGVQQAHVHANEVAKRSPTKTDAEAQRLKERRMAREAAQWKWDVLVPAHVEKSNELSEQRLQLGHLEDHIRQLERRWAELKNEARRLQQSQKRELTKQVDQKQLDDVKTAVAAAERELEKARRAQASRPKSFTLVPYDGPNGTRRRPLYVECTSLGIVLQPEGITLDESFFQGPIGHGNPLASALRAKRDALARSGVLDENNEPYPLLIVRPGGSLFYALAREAMKSWDDEFGYELVSKELTLRYPPKDESIISEVKRAIEAALQRQEYLARAQPRLYPGRRGGGAMGTSMRASPRGGFVPANRGNRQGGSGSATADQIRRLRQQNKKAAGAADAPGHTGPNGPGGPFSRGGMDSTTGPKFSKREKNWGLPNSSGRGLKRFVRVACEANRLTILPARGERVPPRSVALNGPTDRHVDAFVSELWTYMKSWGLALPGRYWEPMLRVEVAPGGEARYREFERLLRNSGVQVSRKP